MLLDTPTPLLKSSGVGVFFAALHILERSQDLKKKKEKKEKQENNSKSNYFLSTRTYLLTAPQIYLVTLGWGTTKLANSISSCYNYLHPDYLY